MGEITVYFFGICTHMQWPEVWGSAPGFQHRIVLVNGSAGEPIYGNPIASHQATLSIAAGDLLVWGVPPNATDGEILEWNLGGTMIEVVNPIGTLSYDESYECCVPHLKALTRDLPEPAERVVTNADPAEASCYFEVTAGVLRAGLVPNKAAVGVLTVRTKDKSPIVRLSSFLGGLPQDIHLRDGAEIAVSNVASAQDDNDNDFLLHYKTAEYIPPHAGVPTAPPNCCKFLPRNRLIGPKQDVGPGCSNSNFP